MTAVERIALAPGFGISRAVTGLWQLADMEREGRSFDREAVLRAMADYVEAGFTTFDLADHYGSAEDVAGLFRASLADRDRIQLLTKWVPTPGRVDRSAVKAAVGRSLERLRTERIDLLQFHAWNYADPSWLDCLGWLAELRAEGLIGELGLTNFDTAHLRVVVASGIPVVSNQVCFSLLDRRPADRMAVFCAERGITLLVYGTVAGGFLTERWVDAPEPDWDGLETWSLMKYGRFIRAAGGWTRFQEMLGTAGRVARRRGVSIANVATRYVLEQPAVGAVVIGARLGASQHVGDNLRLFDLTLTPEDRADLDRAAAGLDSIPGDSGDEYRKPPYLTASGDLSHHLDSIPAPYPVQCDPDGTTRVDTGTVWEEAAGFSRAVRVGRRIWVSGTTATHRGRVVGGADPAAQFHFIADKIEGALVSLGARLEHVVRTRIYLADLAHWEVIARAHGERFGETRPANTMIRAELIGDGYLVEAEAEAMIR